ncbi:MAG: hypothetical protein PX481_20220 [Microcystis sp. M53603_WE2]|uniref:Uncharacterized protein n=1 Tax=Microcystis aeruginosa PCC 9717 TaxID=1160286 RepID=I4FWJ6_MICAE|nr:MULTISPECIES: hypothetical protein [Microcystis]MCE2664302.1 hypothetical protein [Microcystis sp. 53602_E8]MCZ8189231.1 hypothetical protein [Microcystis sp. LE19-338.1B]MCZ8356394.1 hypothetical protein [Microcystis sp. LE19-388.1G]MCZ8363355.1 hypothetical protein [Microcystis sp. LE19-251.1A]MDJ0529995.1 hypothetical protein [Microcystis sp. M53600_WE12]MDJ0564752.1 hypothetical protein [Microcystis sp. M49629_WE12]CCI00021.1 hypothetical protein MICAB_7140012 [Microcystis aeruginosa 
MKSKSTGHWSNGGENSWTFSLKIGKTLHPTPYTPHPTPKTNFLPQTLI